ncbi:MAG: Asp-tRNA(Asn)/Glu-tRNA(Gln) amidotransferase subunit GatA [Firmicutes bacterium]|nr:Asp-tRNA(Asn)/Glu-tRNA(Gln) amidotransferase subunit GatA [Bacillota bacterium]
MRYLDKDLLTIHNALKNGDVTSKELIEESINEIKKYNEKINAFNLLIENAKEVEVNDNLLSGIPYAMKDNISTKGVRTTACSNTLKDYVPVYDATVYENLCKNGAVMIGKTNLDELAMGATGTTGNSGTVRNPWNTKHIAGGSSAGSAAAVALGVVPYAIGTDTGDSIRKPAAFTGVVGYKPSYGLVSRYGLFAFASSLDHIGTFTRNVKDAAIVMDAMKGSDNKDMTSIRDMDDISLYNLIDGNVKGKKLFYIKEICDKNNYVDLDTIKIMEDFEKTIAKIRQLGIEVEEVSIDFNLLNAIKPVYDSLACAEATSNNSNLTGIIFGPRGNGNSVMDVMKDHRTNGFSPFVKRRFVIGSFILQKENQEKYFLNAKRVRRLICNKFNELFKEYDGLILPCAGSCATSFEKAQDKMIRGDRHRVLLENHLAIGNFGGYPSITIPNGFIHEMPTAINITGAFKDDANVLNIASAIEEELGYKNQIVKEVK